LAKIPWRGWKRNATRPRLRKRKDGKQKPSKKKCQRKGNIGRKKFG